MDENPEIKQEESTPVETRHERIPVRRRARGGGSPWLVGLVLIAVGILFLLQNTTGFYLVNWWALFILIPAFGAFSNAYRFYQDAGSLNAPARSSLIGGIVLTMVAAVFLFNLDWAIFGPAMLILGGVALLMSSIAK